MQPGRRKRDGYAGGVDIQHLLRCRLLKCETEATLQSMGTEERCLQAPGGQPVRPVV